MFNKSIGDEIRKQTEVGRELADKHPHMAGLSASQIQEVFRTKGQKLSWLTALEMWKYLNRGNTDAA